MEKTLYQALVDAGIETANHESDLYFPRTDESVKILRTYEPHCANAQTFVNQMNGNLWVDVPFAFDPYWEKKENQRNGSESWRKAVVYNMKTFPNRSHSDPRNEEINNAFLAGYMAAKNLDK